MEFFMGQALGQPEIPANSPRPPATPAEGVIVVDMDPDGFTRRYLYKALGGDPSQVLISEAPTVNEAPAMVEAVEAFATVATPAPAAPRAKMTSQAPLLGRPQVLGSTQRLTGSMPRMKASPMAEEMDQALGQAELPANSPRPPATPAEGIIVVDMDPDGFTRKYLYKALGGEPSQVLISEAPTVNEAPAMAQAAAAVATPAPAAPKRKMTSQAPLLGRSQVLGSTQSLAGAASARMQASPMAAEQKSPLQLQIQSAPRVGIGERMSVSGQQQNVVQKMAPMPVDDSVMANQRPVHTMQPNLGGPTSFLENAVKIVSSGQLGLGHVPQKQVSPGAPLGVFPMAERRLGQAAPPPPVPPPEPAPAPIPPGTCPGAVEMPDGRLIDPEDVIKLQDLCELMPFLLESYQALEQAQQAKSGQVVPGQAVPVVGQQPSAGGAVPSPGSQFGPGGVARAGGGGGFVGGGGGGPGPAGPQGREGVAGPRGFGGIVDSITKVDGDFIAGPGAFIPVPGTSIMFTQGQTGPATFLLTGNLGVTSGGVSLSQSGQMGLRIDGVDYPLVSRLLHTFVGGVGEFIVGQSAPFSLPLTAGSHTVEVILRGLAPGEFGGAAIGTPVGVAASTVQPLYLSVIHS